MSQIGPLVSTLKRELKSQGITYAAVATHLNLSENSVKRLFSESKCSLQRLEQICHLLGLEISDLVQKMEGARQKIDQLSGLQEREIANDPKLLLVAICVLNLWTFEQIIENYTLSEHECVQLLAKLDRLDIIELLPLNRFKVIAAKTFSWRNNGPIQTFFHSKVQPDFFQSSFTKAGEKLLFRSGMLSRGSNAALMKKMERLVADFNELHDEDASQPLEQRFGTSVLVAVRAWEFGLFRELRRSPETKPF